MLDKQKTVEIDPFAIHASFKSKVLMDNKLNCGKILVSSYLVKTL